MGDGRKEGLGLLVGLLEQARKKEARLEHQLAEARLNREALERSLALAGGRPASPPRKDSSERTSAPERPVRSTDRPRPQAAVLSFLSDHSEEWFKPGAIADRLVADGFPGDRYKQFLSVITGACNRLTRKGFLEKEKRLGNWHYRHRKGNLFGEKEKAPE